MPMKLYFHVFLFRVNLLNLFIWLELYGLGPFLIELILGYHTAL